MVDAVDISDPVIRKRRQRLVTDFEYYAPNCLKVLTKAIGDQAAKLIPFSFNPPQRYVHARIEEQRERLGYVRAIILKGRQQGISTYIEGRFYWKTSNGFGQKTYILTHRDEATKNLFAMVERYHVNAPIYVRPHVGRSNQKELQFDQLDSVYNVATAGAKGAGRSATLTNVHGSEVAFWENAQEHLSGMLQAVPLAVGTEVVLESTANGVGNTFHQQWKLAESGQSDFIAIFVPWFWSPEYRRSAPDDFQLNDDPESVPDGELTEAQYATAYRLDDDQMMWRRAKIIELGGGETGFREFQKEYPATADEAFNAAHVGQSLFSRRALVKARRSTAATEGSLIIGVDPGGEGENGDPTAIIRRRTRRMFNPQILPALNTMQIASLCWRIIRDEKPLRMFVDVGGLGAGVVDRLLEMPGTAGIVVPVNFGEAAYDPARFVNRRAEMAWTFRDWLDDPGGANIPDRDDFQAECLQCAIIAPADSNQRRALRSKEWLRSKGVKSGNLLDAACLTLAEPINVALNAAGIGNGYTDFDPLNFGNPNSGIGSGLADFDPLAF